MKTNMRNNYFSLFKIVFFLLFSLLLFSCSSADKVAEEGLKAGQDAGKSVADKAKEAAQKYADQEKEKMMAGPGKPKFTDVKIALIPFDYTVETGPFKAQEAYEKMAFAMLERKSYIPKDLKYWMNEFFKTNKAKNIYQIIKKAKDTEINVEMLVHGKVFKSGNKFGLFISMYPLNPAIKPSYYFRSFSNFNSIGYVAKDILLEMEKRGNTFKNPYFSKKIFIKNFKINFHTYTNLKEGDISFIKLPYLNIEGTSYKSDEYFFNEILLYSFHTTRLFEIWNSNMQKYIKSPSVIPSDMDYIISTDIDISNQISMLTISVHKKGSRVVKYNYPFKSLNLDDLYRVMRENTQNIILTILNNEERKEVGIVQLDALDNFQTVYCNDYYMGDGKQYNMVMASGKVDFTISQEKYKLFISPFVINNRLYKLSEGYLLDLKK